MTYIESLLGDIEREIRDGRSNGFISEEVKDRANQRLEQIRAALPEASTEPESLSNDEATMAEQPVSDRIRRAYANGYAEGLQRATYDPAYN